MRIVIKNLESIRRKKYEYMEKTMMLVVLITETFFDFLVVCITKTAFSVTYLKKHKPETENIK